MDYQLLKEVIDLLSDFENQYKENGVSTCDINEFKKWIWKNYDNEYYTASEPEWEGKEKGRTPESVINTLIVHMGRYAKYYSKSAIHNSKFSSQDDFIYMINLQAFGPMHKMELIKKNVHDKPAGMQIINRLIGLGWIAQKDDQLDRRSKIIEITESGKVALEQQMNKIRQATNIVTGNLTQDEKMELIRLLTKLNDYHLAIYEDQKEAKDLLEHVKLNYTHG